MVDTSDVVQILFVVVALVAMGSAFRASRRRGTLERLLSMDPESMSADDRAQLARAATDDPEERALLERAANDDEAASLELVRRADAATAALRLRAENNRPAALEYRKELSLDLAALESLLSQLDTMDLSDAKRTDVRGRLTSQLAEARHNIAWIEDRLRSL
jgi:hypothetical protein